jgi:threonine synthase
MTPMTPWPEEAARLELASLSLKREDENPTGSHKDRALGLQIEAADSTWFALSSSGNAAIAATEAARSRGRRVAVFVAEDVDPGKLAMLQQRGADCIVCDKPLNYARYAARVFGMHELRGTLDPRARDGYRALGTEIAAQALRVEAVLTFASSGVSLGGLLDGVEAAGRRVAGWAVQAGTALGIARACGVAAIEEPDHPAGRHGLRNPADANALARRLLDGGGGAVVVGIAEAEDAAAALASIASALGPECAATLAGLRRLAPRLVGRHVVAVMTGALRGGIPEPAPVLRSYQDVRARLEGWGAVPR